AIRAGSSGFFGVGTGAAISAPHGEKDSRPRLTGNAALACPRPGGKITRGEGKVDGGAVVTYCLGILTHQGLVMASDSRSNAGMDQVNICRKMHTFVKEGERVFVVLTSGSLSVTQSVITLLRRDFDHGGGLATAPAFYDAARAVGEQVRRVAALDR